MTENQINRELAATLRTLDPAAFVWKVNDSVTPGIPDFHLVRPGRSPLYVEAKNSDQEQVTSAVASTLPTAHQCRVLTTLARLGQMAVLAVYTRPRGAAVFRWNRSGGCDPSPLYDGPRRDLAAFLLTV